MITKERLEELIEQEATIYLFYAPKDLVENKLNLECYCCDDVAVIEIDNNSGCWKNTFPYDDLYETKEEADFVAKYHDTRIEKFEPPFELKDEQQYYFTDKKGDRCCICCSIGSPFRDVDVYGVFQYRPDDKVIMGNFKTYQEAVDYAHKLFKGEE